MKQKIIRSKAGFTLVELSLATLFLAVLLLMIATIIINVSTIYQKGLTLRGISASGKTIIDDVDRSVADAPLMRFKDNDLKEAHKNFFLEHRETAWVTSENGTRKEEAKDVQFSGIFCTGRYSYIWNTGYALNDRDGNGRIAFKGKNDSELKDDFRLIKVLDPMRYICMPENPQRPNDRKRRELDNPQDRYIEMSDMQPEELLADKVSNLPLALYELTIFPFQQDEISLHTFYSGTFVLATIRGGVNTVRSAGDYCDPTNAGTLDGDFNYCAVNKFNFTAQAEGK